MENVAERDLESRKITPSTFSLFFMDKFMCRLLKIALFTTMDSAFFETNLTETQRDYYF